MEKYGGCHFILIFASSSSVSVRAKIYKSTEIVVANCMNKVTLGRFFRVLLASGVLPTSIR